MGFELDENQLNLLRTVTATAAEEATQKFSRWLRGDVCIKMENVEVIPFKEVIERSGGPDEVSIALFMNVDGDLSGALLFVLSEQTAFDLVTQLIRRPDFKVTELDDLAKSALNETANIVGCAYLNSLGNNLESSSDPSPPILMHDLTQAIMNSVVMNQAMYQEESLFIETEFYLDDKKLDWSFFYFPILEKMKVAL